MQKQNRSTKALLVVALMVVSMLFAGCKKSYSSLEDYVKDYPDVLTVLNQSMTNSDVTGKSEVTGNTIVMKLYYNKTVWGQNDSVDAQMKSILDQYFDNSASQLEQSRNEIAQGSGVEASLISFRIESYNPDATTPSYTYTYPKK